VLITVRVGAGAGDPVRPPICGLVQPVEAAVGVADWVVVASALCVCWVLLWPKATGLKDGEVLPVAVVLNGGGDEESNTVGADPTGGGLLAEGRLVEREFGVADRTEFFLDAGPEYAFVQSTSLYNTLRTSLDSFCMAASWLPGDTPLPVRVGSCVGAGCADAFTNGDDENAWLSRRTAVLFLAGASSCTGAMF
jgi:hypothetical protein